AEGSTPVDRNSAPQNAVRKRNDAMKHATRDLHPSISASVLPPLRQVRVPVRRAVRLFGARRAFACASLSFMAATALAAPGVVLFHEDFENGLVDGDVVLLTGYTGVGGETYDSEPNWNNPASCNGFVLDGTSTNADIGALGCNNSTYATQLRNLVTALGTFNGSVPPESNHAFAAYTANPASPANAVELRTPAPVGVSVTNRFLTFSVDVTAVN